MLVQKMMVNYYRERERKAPFSYLNMMHLRVYLSLSLGVWRKALKRREEKNGIVLKIDKPLSLFLSISK